jgi:phosphoethanolamine N-methyltransferase
MAGSSASFLDGGQYAAENIRKYERIYGRDFVSPGGAVTARDFIARLDLSPGARVLDAGCGLGGASFLMAREYAARVEGVDLSENMIAGATARCKELGLQERVSFRQADLLALDAEDAFDAVYSRDVFLHLKDKAALLRTLHRALAPGGELLVTDYCRGEAQGSPAFERYVAERHYHLLTVKAYGKLLEDAGFVEVRVEDLTARFVEIHETELKGFAGDDRVEGELADLAYAWREKIDRARCGEQRWGLFTASKPA